jgi:FkbM family methyltransferase
MSSKYNYTIAKNAYGQCCVPISSSHTYTSQAILRGDIHEPETIKFIIENSKKGDIIHAGAGFGDFLPALSKSCSGKVWSFEPNLENYFCAHKTIELNKLKNISLFKYALGDEIKKSSLRVEKNNKKLGPRCEIDETSSQPLSSELQSIEIVTLDSIIPENSPVSIIHLDVEGYEFQVLRGAKSIISRDSPLIILEIHTEALKYNEYMESINYFPVKQLIYDSGPMVFVNTVYKKGNQNR